MNVNGVLVGSMGSAITVFTSMTCVLLVEDNLSAVFAATLATSVSNAVSDTIAVGSSNTDGIDFTNTTNTDVMWKIFVTEILFGLPWIVTLGVLAFFQKKKKVTPGFMFKALYIAASFLYTIAGISSVSQGIVHESASDTGIRIGLVTGTVLVTSLLIYGIDVLLKKEIR